MAVSPRIQDLEDEHRAAMLPAPLPVGTVRRRELRCTGCGYGAVAGAMPEQCPTCAATEWDFVDWRPFSSARLI